jgi:hypothetical protein
LQLHTLKETVARDCSASLRLAKINNDGQNNNLFWFFYLSETSVVFYMDTLEELKEKRSENDYYIPRLLTLGNHIDHAASSNYRHIASSERSSYTLSWLRGSWN